MFDIYATYRGRREYIDFADTYQDALELAEEYSLSFGYEWDVMVEKRIMH